VPPPTILSKYEAQLNASGARPVYLLHSIGPGMRSFIKKYAVLPRTFLFAGVWRMGLSKQQSTRSAPAVRVILRICGDKGIACTVTKEVFP